MLSAIPPTVRTALEVASNNVISDTDSDDYCDADSGPVQPRGAPEAVARILADAASIITAVTEGKSVTSVNKKKIVELAKSIMDLTRTISSHSVAAPVATPQLGNMAQEIATSVRAEIREEMTQFKNMIASQVRLTYSQAAAAHRGPAPTPGKATSPAHSTPASKPAIIITPRVEVNSKQDTIEAFKKSISFRTSSYAPSRVQSVSNNKLRVEFDCFEQCEDALKRLANAERVSAEPARRLRPMVVLKGISRDVPSEDLVGIIKEQNRELTELIKGEEDLCIRFKRDNRNSALYNVVFLAHPRVYRTMIEMVRVSIDHQRVRADDFSPFIQCHRCLQFGHMRTKCTSTVKPCAHCAEVGHNIDHCPLREKPFTAKCVNCTSHNDKFNTRLDTRHRANSNHCPRLRTMKDKIVNRVDYGFN